MTALTEQQIAEIRNQVLEEARMACNDVRVEHFLAKQQYVHGSPKWLNHKNQAVGARTCLDAICALQQGATNDNN
jgi:hypothetical protein